MESMLLQYICKDKVSLLQEESCHAGDDLPLDTSDSKSYINIEKGVRYCADSREFYEEMLELFYSSYDERVTNITEAYKSEDWKTYTVFVHGLKSTSLNIGGEQLSKAAQELERAGKLIQELEQTDEGRAFILEHHNEVMNLYKATILEAKRILDEAVG